MDSSHVLTRLVIALQILKTDFSQTLWLLSLKRYDF